MQSRPVSALCSVLAAVLVNTSFPVFASTRASVALSGGAEESLYNFSTGTYNQTRDGTEGTLRQEQFDPERRNVSASIVDLRKTGLASISLTGSSTASIAGLRMSALVTGGAGARGVFDGSFVGGNVSVGGAVYDEFVLLAPGLALGTLLDLTASVYTDATTRNNGTAPSGASFETSARWQSTFSLTHLGVGTNAFKLMDQRCRSGTSVESICSGSGPDTGELKLLVPNGAKLGVQLTGFAEVLGSTGAMGPDGSASLEAGADLGSTIAWAGITSLKDGDGNPITDFSAVSDVSGFDYRQAYVSAVPLPPAAILLAPALAGLLAWRGERRQARDA